MRVATYVRISTDETMQPHSLAAQAQRLDAFVQSQEGWRIVRRFEDKASGATIERPALQRMLAEAEVGRFELLLVYKVDRLACRPSSEPRGYRLVDAPIEPHGMTTGA